MQTKKTSPYTKHRYGWLILTTYDLRFEGKWYWSDTFQQVNFVPKGCRNSRSCISLTTPENTREGAIRKVMRHLVREDHV